MFHSQYLEFYRTSFCFCLFRLTESNVLLCSYFSWLNLSSNKNLAIDNFSYKNKWVIFWGKSSYSADYGVYKTISFTNLLPNYYKSFIHAWINNLSGFINAIKRQKTSYLLGIVLGNCAAPWEFLAIISTIIKTIACSTVQGNEWRSSC